MKRLLLTPGPLTTREETRRAMLADWGSREPDFIALTAELRRRLLDVANGADTHTAVPLQGSGTFIVEAAIASFVRPTDKLLVLVNGAYGERIVTIAKGHGHAMEILTWPEDRPIEPARVAEALAADATITDVALVHCETTSGVLNPIAEVAEVVRASGRRFILDAMSSFGALPIDLAKTHVDVVLASSNKGLEGAPGLGFALVRRDLIEGAMGVSPSLSFDLHAQWKGFESNGQWRFTPPVQVVAALVEALRLLEVEGGPPARLKRYRANFEVLAEGMTRLGFPLYLDCAVQAPIIATFRPPTDRPFSFEDFYADLAAKGFVIYPGKLTKEPSFRIGCIGAVTPGDMRRLIAVIEARPAASPAASAA